MKALGHDIILMMDANEDITTKPGVICAIKPIDPEDPRHTEGTHHDGTLASLAKTRDLADVLAIQHPRRKFPATYIRGTRRYYILVTSRLTQAVIRSGLMGSVYL